MNFPDIIAEYEAELVHRACQAEGFNTALTEKVLARHCATRTNWTTPSVAAMGWGTTSDASANWFRGLRSRPGPRRRDPGWKRTGRARGDGPQGAPWVGARIIPDHDRPRSRHSASRSSSETSGALFTRCECKGQSMTFG